MNYTCISYWTIRECLLKRLMNVSIWSQLIMWHRCYQTLGLNAYFRLNYAKHFSQKMHIPWKGINFMNSVKLKHPPSYSLRSYSMESVADKYSYFFNFRQCIQPLIFYGGEIPWRIITAFYFIRYTVFTLFLQNIRSQQFFVIPDGYFGFQVSL